MRTFQAHVHCVRNNSKLHSTRDTRLKHVSNNKGPHYGNLYQFNILLLQKLNTIHEDIQITYITRAPGSLRKILREIKMRQYQYTVMELNYKQPRRLPSDLKYVLKWTEALSHYSTSVFVRGQKAFIDNNCTFYNCYMTNDKSLLADLRYFDAILFDVENHWDSYPPIRTPFQSYIFTASEPASMYPVCDPVLDSFYNATWTYKLDSTIPQPFLEYTTTIALLLVRKRT